MCAPRKTNPGQAQNKIETSFFGGSDIHDKRIKKILEKAADESPLAFAVVRTLSPTGSGSLLPK